MNGIVLGSIKEDLSVVILGNDDRRYRLRPCEWKSKGTPLVGMKVDFVIDGELAKEAFHIPRSMDSALKNGTPLSFYVGHRLWWRRMVNIWDLLPSHLRSPRTLILSVVLLGIVTYVIGNFAEEQFQEAKLEREAPADEAEVRQELFSYQKQKGYAIAVQMWQARAGEGKGR